MATGSYTQQTRRMAIETPLGKDKLLMTSFNGQEELSRLFSYDLDLRSDDDSIRAGDIVGKNVTFWVDFPDGEHRYFNGFVNRFSFCGTGDRLSIYRARVVPWTWFLTKTADCRIFQEMTVPDIIEKVLGDLGFSDYELKINGDHPEWVYCVQYRETDYNFLCRLMEHEGIFYYFKHENGKHTMVMSDDKSGYYDLQDNEVEFGANLSGPELPDHISRWEHQHEYRTGKWTHTDYDFEKPSTDLKTSTDTLVPLEGNKKYEIYDYPGIYLEKSEGEAEIKVRMEETEVSYDVVHGESWCRSFSPGGKFKMKTHHCKAEEGKGYMVTAVRHMGTLGSTYVPGGYSADGSYSNSFTCIPDKVTYRPQRVTPKPTIQGVQTAVVVGPSGEEIYPDKYGRIKVQFHWDREGKKDEKSSCWIRCSQISAGKQWGGMFIPRIGQEVVVTYEEGDPDRPLVTGVVYNAEQMPHYALPDEKTKSYVKTNSSMGGDGHNEVRFEDKAGEEQFYMHAQKNMDVRVLNDSMEIILNDRHQIIGDEEKKTGNQRELIWENKHLNVKQDQVEKIEANYELTVGHGDSGPGDLDVLVEGDKKLTIGGDNHVHVKKDRNEKVDGKHSLQARAHHEKLDMDFAVEAQNIHIKAGTSLVLEAGVIASLKVGGNYVTVSTAGVMINGSPVVLINSGGAAATGLGAQPGTAQDAKQAQPDDPTEADESETGQASCP